MVFSIFQAPAKQHPQQIFPNARWYGFVVNTTAVINTADFVYEDGTAVSGYTPSWFDVSLAVGMFIPCGVYNGKAIYANSITLTSGTVLAYFD